VIIVPQDDQQVKIDVPHEPFGQHVDIITPLSNVNGVQKLRIGSTGSIISDDILISDKKGP
jgi:hypothetical protein